MHAPDSSEHRAILQRYLALAEEHPNADALIIEREPFAGVRRTWADLVQRSEDIGKRLERAGAGPGTRCAFILSDHPDVIPALLALWRFDATAVLIDKSWGPRRRESMIAHGRATLLLSFGDELELATSGFASDVAGAPPLPAGTALLGYTSGSTGDPKGIAFTHQKLGLTLHAAACAVTGILGRSPKRIGCSMRLSGSGVLNLHYTWAAFADAAVVVLPELTFGNARDYWARVEANGVEQTFLVPTLIELINQLAAPRPGIAEPPICLTGSAPLAPRTQQRFHERFGLPLRNAYGLSETMCASFFGACDATGFGTNSVGVPWLLHARLRDERGTIVEGEGEGTIELSGPTVFDGYYDNPAATRAAFDGRWFTTGDVGRRDAEGRYWIVGRTKDVVMKGGYSVYLNEVEEAAVGIHGVLEAAAIPVELPRGGEDIGLIVRLDPRSSLSERELLRALEADLGAQRSPYRVQRFEDRLPRTGQDKLDRRQLKELWTRLTTSQSTETTVTP